jgi:tRNA pseudouridine13 synthase
MQLLEPLPTLNASLQPLGGIAKTLPEDFAVEEIPAYAPSGSGEHLLIWLQKVGMPAHVLLRHVSTALGVMQRDIGCAGLKDAQATTRQYISVPAGAVKNLDRLAQDPRVTVLHSGLHGNKLKTGHLRGNKFQIKVRGCNQLGPQQVAALVDNLKLRGLPNYFGSQRFGRNGATLNAGLQLLGVPPPAGTEPSQSPRRRPQAARSLHRLALSSVQSALFNRYIADRLAAKTLHRVLAGEVLQVCASGGPFTSDDTALQQSRFDAQEIVGAGPMFGPKMRPASGEVLAHEARLLQEAGLQMSDFAAHKNLLQGTRRANCVYLPDLQVDLQADGVAVVQVSLPSGSYATVLLQELGCSIQAAVTDRAA